MDPAWITVANKTLQPHGSVKSKLAIKIIPENVIRCPNTSKTVYYFAISQILQEQRRMWLSTKVLVLLLQFLNILLAFSFCSFSYSVIQRGYLMIFFTQIIYPSISSTAFRKAHFRNYWLERFHLLSGSLHCMNCLFSKINIPHCIYLALLALQYLYFVTEFTELHDASAMDTLEYSLVILLLCHIMNGELSFEVSCSNSMCMSIRVTQSKSQLNYSLS